MAEQQVLQELELANRVISRSRCLLALETTDANTQMGCQYHVHIVGSVSNCQCSHLFLFFEFPCSNKLDDLCFLLRGYTTSNNNAGFVGQVKEVIEHFSFFLWFGA